MRGGSQSCLLQASDGNFYIAKLLGNPQGSKVLFNEALGTELMRNLGFSVPSWKPIEISAEFINSNPEIWFETAFSGHQQPPTGIHFASEFLAANHTETIYEILPRNWFARVKNREAFVGALLFDLWVGQIDNRQAIFTRNLESASLQAVFIDQGGLFGDATDSQLHKLVRAMYIDSTVYAGLDIDSVVSIWESRIRNLDLLKICSSIFSMAVNWQWYTPVNFNQMVIALRKGQTSLEEYGRLIKLALKTSADALINAQDERLDDVQICGPQLRSHGHKRIDRSVSRVG
jgi:hypothetical protein